jgi:hypothetical protein
MIGLAAIPAVHTIRSDSKRSPEDKMTSPPTAEVTVVLR